MLNVTNFLNSNQADYVKMMLDIIIHNIRLQP
jgi:hypothetical protein